MLPVPSISTAPTIAAVASGWGHSRRALVRVSGPAVPSLAGDLLRPPPPRPWSLTRAGFRLTDTLDLTVLAQVAEPPRSFTGEACLELIVPGNPVVLERVMDRLVGWSGAGATRGAVREAQPGEFSARAFLNGKLTLDQAEGIAATIAARTQGDLEAARRLLSGQTGDLFRRWSADLAMLLALVEAGIDFTDQEDVVPIAPAALRARLEALAGAIASHTGASAGREHASHLARAVLIGPPNAGKSTLFNALLGRRRAVESPVPGTTRDALVEPLDLGRDAPGAGVVLLVDLAGLDDAATGDIDRQAQARAREEIALADILLMCRPAGARPGDDAAIDAGGRPVIRVRTKADLPHANGDEPEAIGVCALDGWNLAALRRALADASFRRGEPSGAFLLPRHARALAAALDHLGRAGAAVDAGARSLPAPEVIATDLRGALEALGELTGQISPDDILGRIFSTFCIGK